MEIYFEVKVQMIWLFWLKKMSNLVFFLSLSHLSSSLSFNFLLSLVFFEWFLYDYHSSHSSMHLSFFLGVILRERVIDREMSEIENEQESSNLRVIRKE